MTTMDIRKTALALAALLPANAAWAAPDISISGFVDTSAHYNANNPDSQTSSLRSYDSKAQSFYLNAVHGAFSVAPVEGASIVVELDAGSDAAFNRTGSVSTVEFDVQEAYVTYVFHDSGFGFRAGKWATYEGIEVIEGPDNPTITRGFLFNLAECCAHVGAVATWKSGGFDAALGAVNGWDVVVDNNTGKTILGKAAYAADDWGVTGSFTAGPEQAGNSHDYRQSYDVTGFVIVEGVKVNLQVNYGNEDLGATRAHWIGGGIQPVIPVTDALSVGARVERFRDPEGARTGVAGGPTVTNVTVAPAYAVTKALTVRVEARVDVSSGGDAFESASGDPKDTQTTVGAEVFYRF
jgi:hypothetical protein